MLIISRRIGESFIIDDDIIVTILDVCGTQVRVGVEAPESTQIFREELYTRIQQEREVQNG